MWRYLQLTKATDEEIELDIDALEKGTLWKLYLYVKKHTQPAGQKRAEGDILMKGNLG
jgi:Bromodomain extra-terminal - transcription regulation